MSNDPQGHYRDEYPPRPGEPDGGAFEQGRRDDAGMRSRVQGPGIGLIVVGVVNVILGLIAGSFGAFYAAVPKDELEKMMLKQNPQLQDQMKQMGWTLQDFINVYVYSGFTGGALGVVTGILAIVAGARMLALKSYGFAVFTSVLVALPCISCSGCCGLGEGIGIWALVVLLNEEVKAAFH
jgi:hypothetical protein